MGWRPIRSLLACIVVLGVMGTGSPEGRLRVDEAQVTHARQALGSDFKRYETEHFIILTSCSRAWTQNRAGVLERTQFHVERVARSLKLETTPLTTKLLCILFDDHDEYRAFASSQDRVSAEWIAGYYATGSNRIVLFDDRDSPSLHQALGRLEDQRVRATALRERAEEARSVGRDDIAARLEEDSERFLAAIEADRGRLEDQASAFSTAKTIHEAVHLIAFNTGIQRRDRIYPFWISEGMATSFETDNPSARFGPDAPSEARLKQFHSLREQDRLMPLAELVVLTDVPGDDPDLAEAMYHQSFALFVHLYRADRASLTAYMHDIAARSDTPMTEKRRLSIFRKHFGDPSRLERRLRRL